MFNSVTAHYTEQAENFVNALKTLCNSETATENFICYLSYHFPEWLKDYCQSIDDITSEIQAFSKM